MKHKHYTSLLWFRISVAFGFAINMVFVIPALFAPRILESLIAVGTTNTLWWLQNVGILLLIISVMYIPAIKDPFRYLFISVLLVGARFSAAMLFLIGVLFMDYPPGMRVLLTGDLGLSTLQAVLLYFMLRNGDPRARTH